MTNYLADPLSRATLRQYALNIRKSTGCESEWYYPILRLLEALPTIFDGGNDGLSYVVLQDNEFAENIHAEYDLDENCIKIRESIYDGAYAGKGRDRMTIAHEISHFLLIKANHVRLYHSGNEKIRSYQDPEWQAKCLAAELLIPESLVKGMSPFEVSQRCGVSFSAAEYQLKHIN